MLPDKSYLFVGIASPKSSGGRLRLGVKRYLLSAVFAAETKVTCLRGSLFGIPLLPLVASVMGILGIGRTYGGNCP